MWSLPKNALKMVPCLALVQWLYPTNISGQGTQRSKKVNFSMLAICRLPQTKNWLNSQFSVVNTYLKNNFMQIKA